MNIYSYLSEGIKDPKKLQLIESTDESLKYIEDLQKFDKDVDISIRSAMKAGNEILKIENDNELEKIKPTLIELMEEFKNNNDPKGDHVILRYQNIILFLTYENKKLINFGLYINEDNKLRIVANI